MSSPGNHISMVSLGVDDLPTATHFYEQLGWKRAAQSQDSISFMIGRNLTLGLYGRTALAQDAGVEDGVAGFSGVALAANFPSREDVDAFAEQVTSAGGELVKAPQEVFWGGYSGYFKDLDGHLWEIAHNPFVTLGDDGQMPLDVTQGET